MSDKEIIKRIEDHGANAQTSKPAEFGAQTKSELAECRAVVQKAKVTVD